MKKRLLSILLCLCMALSLLPMTALAANASSVSVGGATLNAGNPYLVNNFAAASGTLGENECTAQFDANTGTLTLKGATITSYAAAIKSSGDLTLVLSGTNTVNATGTAGESNRGILVDGNLIIKKQDSDSGNLTITAHSDGIYTNSGDLTIQSGTITTTASGMNNGICALGGKITIEGGSVTATGVGAGIYAQNGIAITGGTVTGTVTGADGAYGIQGGQNTATLTVSGSSDVTGVAANGASASAKAIFWGNGCSVIGHAVYAGANENGATLQSTPTAATYQNRYVRLTPAVMLVDLDGTSGNDAVQYTDFATGWNAAIAGNTSNTTVKLLADWTADPSTHSFGTGVGFGSGSASGTGYIRVSTGKNISLDLNGYDINRSLTTAMEYGYVIVDYGTLTIEDNRAADVNNQGKITGGYNSYADYSAGGIFVAGSGILILRGGQITGNKALNWGGGVYMSSGTTFNMTGGKISGNIANYGNDSDGGAGGVFNNGAFTMTGGEISDNYACGSVNGGGVYVYDRGTITVSGAATITNNKSGATFSNGSATGGTADNVYLPDNKLIAVSDALTGSIGVTTATDPTQGNPVTVTTGTYKLTSDDAAKFTSDNSAYAVALNESTVQLVAASVITTAAIAGVTAPVAGAAPVSAITECEQYTGTVSWSDSPSTFDYATAYTATITLTPKAGYTLTSVIANFFTVAGATATNSENSGTITAVFPATGSTPPPSDPYIPPAPVSEIKSEGSVSGYDIDSLVSGNKELTVTGGDGARLVFSSDALEGINEQTSGSVTVKIEDVSKEHQDVHAGKQVFSLTVSSDGKTLSDFGGSVTVSLPYELKLGQKAGDVSVWHLADDGSMTEIPCVYDAKTKLATFAVTHFSQYVVGVRDWVNPFADVAETDWFYGDVAFANAAGLMNGVSDEAFDPHGTTTRGMAVTLLYRLEGEPAFTGDCPFDDVAADKYYERAVTWAAGLKLIEGYDNGDYGPENAITREQTATLLYRYAQYKGGGFTGEWMFQLDSPDADKVSDWAYEAMCWCAMNKLIEGDDAGALAPQGSAERCQVAAILHRFCQSLNK